MKPLIAILMLFAFGSAHAEVSVEIYCFSSGAQPSIDFELRAYYDDATKWSGAFVKYAKGKSLIPLVLVSEQETPLAEGRPFEVTRRWLEISGGKITGEYDMDSQGALVNAMVYTNDATGKKYYFSINPGIDFSEAGGCQWSSQK